MALLDTQKHADTLRKGGVSDRQARAHVRVLQDVLLDGVATKSDIKELRAEIRELRMEMRAEMKEMRTETRNFQRMFYMGVAFMAFWGPTMIFAAEVFISK